MIVPQPHRTYDIELCSGERRRWTCLGPGMGSTRWWRDCETGREFSEASLMYAWRIVAEHGPTER